MTSPNRSRVEDGVLYTLRHIVSILLLPVTVTVLVPLWLVEPELRTAWVSDPTVLRIAALIAGIAVLAVGLWLIVSTIGYFARVGRGTLAPWDPPRVLVVEGVYRHVRNPMISGVLFVLASEVLATGSRRLLVWFGTFAVANLLYIPLLEEPMLGARFGERYRLYRAGVPRWIPRVAAWRAPWEGAERGDGEGPAGAAPS